MHKAGKAKREICLGQVFNSRLGRFAPMQAARGIHKTATSRVENSAMYQRVSLNLFIGKPT
jgi:hypothetical protein